MQTDIVGVTTGVLGIIIGIIVSYYFYRKSIRIKEPVYSIKSNNLITGNVSTLENLKITYKNYKVENLTVSKFLFYNRGAEPITRQDIHNPIRISSETCKILDGSILQTNNPSNNLTVDYSLGNKNVCIVFDYLNQNNGAVIQVIHTGLSSGNLEISGDIIGVEKLEHISSELFPFTDTWRYRTTMALSVIFFSCGYRS